jgi:hypothetical protein
MSEKALNSISVEDAQDFLKTHYHMKIIDLCAQFPEERSLYVKYQDIFEHNQHWAQSLVDSPNEFLSIIEKGLLKYPEKPPHGQLTFNDNTYNKHESPFVRIDGFPNTAHPNGLTDEVGCLVNCVGLVTELQEAQARICEAVYECENCNSRINLHPVGQEFEPPATCSHCNKEGCYQLDSTATKHANTRFITLIPSDENQAPKVEVELRHSLIDSVEVGNQIGVVGVPYYLGESNRIPNITLLANSLDKSFKRTSSEIESISQKYLGIELQVTESFENSVEQFFNRSSDILHDKFRAEQMTEEEAQAKIITPLFHTLGWDIFGRQVRIEYSEPGSNGQVDYMLMDEDKNPIIPAEAKSPHSELDNNIKQIKRYLETFNCEIGLLTNGEEYRLYALQSGDNIRELYRFTLNSTPPVEILQFLTPRVQNQLSSDKSLPNEFIQEFSG